MKALFTLCIALAVAACGAPSSAQNVHQAGEASRALTVQNAWAAPTPSGVDVSAGYLTINNASSAEDRLLSVTSPRAERVEIHEMSMDGAVMRMRPVTVLAIAAGERVNLGPGGKHLMFYGVSRPFAQGEEIPVQLTFATAGVIDVVLPVRRSAPQNHGGH